MAQRRMGIMVFLLCICLCLLPCYVQATSTADAAEPISLEKECTLTLSYVYDGTGFAGVPVDLYQIADVSPDFQYTPTPSFADAVTSINGVRTAGEWNVIRTTLEAHILSNHIQPYRSDMTDDTGKVVFSGLRPGLYLAISETVMGEDLTCAFDSALVSLPTLDADGIWQYQVVVTPKPQVLPPIEPDETLEYKVLKLWQGDSGYNGRPKSIEVELFRNGSSYEIVTLSEENHWSYTWTEEDPTAKWMATEHNVPTGYLAALEQRGMTFVLTNSLNQDAPTPSEQPKTGDTANILLYSLLMYLSGILLILLGISRKRKRV